MVIGRLFIRLQEIAVINPVTNVVWMTLFPVAKFNPAAATDVHPRAPVKLSESISFPVGLNSFAEFPFLVDLCFITSLNTSSMNSVTAKGSVSIQTSTYIKGIHECKKSSLTTFQKMGTIDKLNKHRRSVRHPIRAPLLSFKEKSTIVASTVLGIDFLTLRKVNVSDTETAATVGKNIHNE
ncbi:hypothetical protein HK099_008062 [Clydaea vesicula]|uniref:Uncharacterized protein n=1 Tax=Clydaea vesicula TaxID=447962 RepID=A0AAD5XXW0_9FUNG|nr:hypothetical protein HK099_008062 [Clydaea vesicula]